MNAARDSRIVWLAQQIADHTRTECEKCRAPLSCCSREYCDMALVIAREEWATDLSDKYDKNARVPFLVPGKGCTVAPHMRPLCTLHTCDVNNLGVKPGDQEWTRKYFKLRNEYEVLGLRRWEERQMEEPIDPITRVGEL